MDAETLRAAVRMLTGVRGVRMDAAAVVDDVLALAEAFPTADLFAAAMANTARALGQIAVGKVAGTPLAGVFEGWQSYHFQSERTNGAQANMRIVYRRHDATVDVLGFGHRWLPLDVYAAISSRAVR